MAQEYIVLTDHFADKSGLDGSSLIFFFHMFCTYASSRYRNKTLRILFNTTVS